MKYFDELKKSMNYLADNDKTIFIGQAVEVPGTAMTNTLKEVNSKKLLELPVAEEMQMGMTNGFAINGQIPISIFPRWNFLLLAINQLIKSIINYIIDYKLTEKNVPYCFPQKKIILSMHSLFHNDNFKIYFNEITHICSSKQSPTPF